jgi:hypothetical protein
LNGNIDENFGQLFNELIGSLGILHVVIWVYEEDGGEIE